MVTYWADYSAAKLSAATLKAAGYTGVIRYIDAPENLGRKHTNLAEYREHVANGLAVWLVFERGTNDPLSGFAGGQVNARRALAGAKLLGYAGPIFMCCDRWFVKTGEPTITAAVWRSYLDGAASVLGKERLGAYGFSDAMDAALGHTTYYWQCGSRRVVRPHVHLWQDNTVQPVVGGIATDRNLIIKPEIIGVTDMPLTDEDIRRIWAYGALGKNLAGQDRPTNMENAIVSPWAMMFYDTKYYGKSIVNRLNQIEGELTALRQQLSKLTESGVKLTGSGEITIKPE